MTSSNILLTFAAALVGVLGTGVGILASLYTIELVNKRGYSLRLVKIWRLLDFERNAIVKQSENKADHLPEAESPTPMIISSFSIPAWQTVRSNAEFIADTPQELLNKLNGSYGIVERLNIMLANYVTSSVTPLSDHYAYIGTYHRSINEQRKVVALEFRELEGVIASQIKTCEQALKKKQRKMDAFSWGARIFFLILVIVILLYGVCLILWPR